LVILLYGQKHAQHLLLGCEPREFYFSLFKCKHLLNTHA